MKLDRNTQLGPDFGSYKVSTIFVDIWNGNAELETGGSSDPKTP